MHNYAIDGEVRQRRDDACPHHGPQERNPQSHEREERERIHQEPGHKRGRQEEQQRRVNTGRILQGPEVAGRVSRLVHLDDGYLLQLHIGARGAQQHGELVLVLITRNL